MLARAAAVHCAASGDDVFAFARESLDVTDRNAVNAAISDIRPDAVINCAAFTDVDASETDSRACFAANADGVANLANACKSVEAAFVTISTDYVFDGSGDGFYTQKHAPNPLGAYARAKREGEILAFAAYPRSIIVRSGWIYGDGGKNFLSVIPKLLGEGKPVRAIADSYGTPTYAGDLAGRLRELARADLPGVYHVVNHGDGCSYYDFARKVCEIGGFDHGVIQPISHAELERPAPRPVNSKLACLISEKIGLAPMRKWDDALADFLG